MRSNLGNEIRRIVENNKIALEGCFTVEKISLDLVEYTPTWLISYRTRAKINQKINIFSSSTSGLRENKVSTRVFSQNQNRCKNLQKFTEIFSSNVCCSEFKNLNETCALVRFQNLTHKYYKFEPQLWLGY